MAESATAVRIRELEAELSEKGIRSDSIGCFPDSFHYLIGLGGLVGISPVDVLDFETPLADLPRSRVDQTFEEA